MKTVTPTLAAFINARNVFEIADLYDIFLADGTNLRLTDASRAIEYPATGTVILDLDGNPSPGVFDPFVGVKRDPIKWTAAPEVQSLGITLMVGETDLYNGAPIAQRAVEGLFDQARFRVYRAFFNMGALVDVLLHFEGLAADVNPTSTQIQISVKSELDTLSIQLPQNLFQPGCAHAFLSEGCDPNPPGTLRASVTATGVLVGTPTDSIVAITGTAATNFYQLGVIHMTSGVCAGQRRGIRSDTNGGGGHQLTLATPFLYAPAAGDSYSITRGCPRTAAACAAYGNSARFRGFPYIPRPEDIR